jgi:O-antigen/teichoic acid export membrane protein
VSQPDEARQRHPEKRELTASEETLVAADAPEPREGDRAVVPAGPHWARSTFTVAPIYAGAIGLLLVGELLLARHISTAAFGGYQLVRQAIPVISVLALLGYDQSLTRETALRAGVPAAFDTQQLRLVVGAVVLGALSALYLTQELHVPLAISSTLSVSAGAVALSSLVSGVMRASQRSALAALTQQGGRLFAGLVLIAAWPLLSGAGAAVVLSLSSVAIALVGVLWIKSQRNTWTATDADHRLMRRLGIGFSLSMLSLAAGDWLDQALLAHLSNDLGVVGGYAQVKLVTVYPILSIGSVLGFVALPELARRRDTLTERQVLSWMVGCLAASAAAAALLAPVSRLVLTWLFGVSFDWRLVITLSIVGALRLFYVLPSAMLGALSTPRVMAQFGGLGFLGLAVQIVVTLVAAHGGLMMAAALGLAAATLLRVALSSLICVRLVKRRSMRALEGSDSCPV